MLKWRADLWEEKIKNSQRFLPSTMPALGISYIIVPGMQVRKSPQAAARGAAQLGRMCKIGGAQKVACGLGGAKGCTRGVA